MAVKLTVSRSSLGSAIADNLSDDELGLNHGSVDTNVTTLEEVLYIRHDDSINPITDLKIYIENLAELLEWGDANSNEGLLIDTDNNGLFDLNFKTGQGDSVTNAINLGDINPSEEKVIRLKIKVPGDEDEPGIRKFNKHFNFDFTP